MEVIIFFFEKYLFNYLIITRHSSAAKIIIESMKGCNTVLSLMQLPVTNYSHNESESSSSKSDNNSESDGYHSESESDEQK